MTVIHRLDAALEPDTDAGLTIRTQLGKAVIVNQNVAHCRVGASMHQCSGAP
ncbi:hypothetical protein ABE527_20925 [Brucella sp. TWI432]